ncbi:MAG: GTP-binding protein, partial [Pseudomonadota bacterium]
HHHGHHRHDVNRHDENIRAVCLTVNEPLSVKVFDAWFRQLSDLRGKDLLRVKGILNVAELQRPMVIHGVQHVWHEPEILPQWPSDSRSSKIVFIVRNLSLDALREALSSIRESFDHTKWTGLDRSEIDAIVADA